MLARRRKATSNRKQLGIRTSRRRCLPVMRGDKNKTPKKHVARLGSTLSQISGRKRLAKMPYLGNMT